MKLPEYKIVRHIAKICIGISLVGQCYSQVPVLPNITRQLLLEGFSSEQRQDLASALQSVVDVQHKIVPPAMTLRHAFAEPPQFPQLMAQSWAASPAAFPADPQILLQLKIQSYAQEFELAVDCQSSALMLPASLEEAMLEIEQLAIQVQSLIRQGLNDRAAKNLTRELNEMIQLVGATPYAADLSRSQQRRLRRFSDRLADAGRQNLLCAAELWSGLLNPGWLTRVHQLMQDHPQANESIITRQHTELGEILFAGSASSRWQEDNVLFLADLGGDDIYGIENHHRFDGLPSLLVDFAGDDIYESGRGLGVGAAVGSVGLLLDLQGDDSYQGVQLGLGAAIFGVGALIDAGGNDNYDSGMLSQGFAWFGLGLLVDESGDDRYQIGALGQGVGLPGGLGWLEDVSGNDRYSAKGAIPTNYGTPGLTDGWSQGVGLGFRDLAPGGIGVFVDREGIDLYDAGSLSQGGGYYFGLGIFQDLGQADDRYLGSRYNFGWGAHAGAGYFFEQGGNDHYLARQAVSAGLAWDHSLAFFHDAGGDDEYQLGEFSLGASAHQSMAWFVDGAGADLYRGVVPAEAVTGPPNFSLFMDIGGQAQGLPEFSEAQNCLRVAGSGFLILAERLPGITLSGCGQ